MDRKASQWPRCGSGDLARILEAKVAVRSGSLRPSVAGSEVLDNSMV